MREQSDEERDDVRWVVQVSTNMDHFTPGPSNRVLSRVEYGDHVEYTLLARPVPPPDDASK